MRFLTEKPEHGAVIGVIKDGVVIASRELQLYLDAITLIWNDNLGSVVKLPSYTVANLPPISQEGGMIYVSDESGGAVTAFSDGVNWRRTTDRVIVS